MGILDAPSPTLSTFNKAVDIRPANAPFRIVGRNFNPMNVTVVNANFPSYTSRIAFTIKGDVSMLKFGFFNVINATGGFEGANSGNTVINSMSLEYPVGQSGIILPKAGVSGYNSFQVNYEAGYMETDPIGTFIPANTTAYLRTFTRQPFAPTSLAASLASGGSLTVGTAYYYFISTIDIFNNLESLPSASATVTPTSGNQSASLTWVRNSFATCYRIYRSTTNTATSALLIATVLDPVQSFTDNGLAAVAVSPIATSFAKGVQLNQILSAGDSANYAGVAGDGSDQTNTTGNISGYSGSATGATQGYRPGVILGDDKSLPSVLLLSDSIGAGTGILANVGDYNKNKQAWFEIGNAGYLFHSLNMSVPGTRIADYAGSTNAVTKTRTQMIRYADYVWLALGINDITTGWQAIANNHLKVAKKYFSLGKRYILNTLPPRVLSTDNGLTIANQSFDSTVNNDRILFNTWVRNGCQVDGSGSAVQSGGTPSPFIYKYFEAANLVEANSSNVLTQNGGYWQVPSSALLGNLTLSGAQTTGLLNIGSVSWLRGQYYGYVVKVETGAAAGQIALISRNDTNTLNLYANGTANTATGYGNTYVGLTTAPASGDKISIWDVPTFDGLHPTQAGAFKIGTGATTFMNNNIKLFSI